MKKFFATILALAVIFTCATSSASETLIEASGSYVMDSRLDETPASATARAREEAKRAAVEKAGVYLMSYSKLVNLELDTDEVQTVAARLLKIQEESSNVEVVEKNLLKFTVTIKALVDDLDEDDLKALMQDKQSLAELTRKNKELQEKYDALNQQMELYRQNFDAADESRKVSIKREVALNTDKFYALDELAKGNDFSFRKDYAHALEAYDKSINFDSHLPETYNNRGIIKYELGQFSEAVEDYTRALQLKTNFAEALNNRGNAFLTLGQFDRAEQDLQAALKLDANSAVVHNNLGSVYLLKENYDEALKEYEQAINLNPNFAEAYYNRAVAYYRLGNFDSARRELKQALALNPNDTRTKDFYEKISRQVSDD